MRLSNANLTTLRTQPHRTNLHLSIYRPKITFICQVNGEFSTGETTITWDNTVSGSYTAPFADETVLIGTQPNSDDIGRIRFRSITSSQVEFAENSIVWQDNLYLTFKRIVSVEAIYPKIIQDPSNQTNVIFYKDNDIAYSNQNSIYGTFPCAGPHRALFLDAGTGTVYYTATGTYNVKGDSLTYDWLFEGGTPTGSTALSPGDVRYHSCGHYVTRLIVTSSSGATDTTYRYVSVYQRPENETCVPPLKWELKNLSGSRAEGGYTASFKIFESLGEIEPNALVVIFADDWYGNTRVSLGGNASGNEKIVFVGYILKDTIQFNYKESSVEFMAGSITEVMKASEGFSVSCESKASPTTWFELHEMTVAKAMYHYLRWHSTILKVADFQYTGDDRYVQYFDADRGSLFDAIDNFMRVSMLGELNADRQGKLWTEISSFGLQTPFDSIPTNLTFHKQDWMGSPSIEERRNSAMSFIELGGIAFYGVTTNTFAAFLSNAPSVSPLYHGKSNKHEGLILLSQQQLNQVAGNYLAHHNTRFPEVSMPLAGNYRNLDIAPQEKFYLVIDQNDSVRGKSIQDLPYRLMSMDWNYDAPKESFYPSVVLEQIATGTVGQSVAILTAPPDVGYSYPRLHLPPLPVFNSPATTSISSTTTRVLIHDRGIGLIYTENFDSASPTWRTVNAGLTQTQYQTLNFLEVCPNGAVYVGKIANDGTSFLFRAPSIGGTFVAQTYPSHLVGAAINPLSSEQIAIITNTGHLATATFRIGANNSFSAPGATFQEGFTTVDRLSFGGNHWLFTLYDNFIRINAAGSAVVATGGISPSSGRVHYRVGTTGITFHNPQLTDALLKGTDNCASVATVNSGNSISIMDENATFPAMWMDSDPLGNYMMTRGISGGSGAKARSADGGSTWVPIPNLPNGNWFFQYAGGDGTSSRWVAISGSQVLFSTNFGDTWPGNKLGNMLTLNPIPNGDMIRVIGI